MRGRRQRWSVIAVVAAVLVVVSGCGNGLLDVEENESDPETYTVTFERQGGVGGTTSVTATVGSPMPFATAPTLAGQAFSGYYTEAAGGGTQYYTAEMASARNWDIPANTELVASWRPYDIGETGPAGGIVFYDKGEYTDGWRYLEAAPASTEWTNKVWGGYVTASVSTGTATGTGAANTQAIVLAFGDAEPFQQVTDYAAKLASDLFHGGYDDWFLPSRDELGLMYDNLEVEGLGDFGQTWYWSSSQFDSASAWRRNFDNGDEDYNDTDLGLRVRAARAF